MVSIISSGGIVCFIGRAHKCVYVIDPCTFPIILSGVTTNGDSSAFQTTPTSLNFKRARVEHMGAHMVPCGPMWPPPCTS